MITSLNEVPDPFSGLTRRERTQIYKRRYKKKMASKGRCIDCGAIAVTKRFCRRCADKHRIRVRRYLAKRGLTPYEHFKSYYIQRKTEHRCVYCGAPLPDWWQGVACTNCLMRINGCT